MAANDILRNYLERVKRRIIDEQSGLGIKLTGFSARSLMVERTRSSKSGRFEAGATLSSVNYLVTNFDGVGVGPGVFPPFGKESALFEWVKKRGIIATTKEGRILTQAQTTFLVARSIYLRGTDINRGAVPGIDFEQITADELPDTAQDLALLYGSEILEDFNKAILIRK